MELNDAMYIIAAFSPDSNNKEIWQEKGKEALTRMAEQVDGIVSALDHQAEEASFH